jgi:hypothetical protein
LVEREEAGASKVFEKCLKILSTENSSPCKNMFGKTIGVPKTASAGERPVSSLGCTRSLRSTQNPCCSGIGMKRILEAAVESLDCALRLVAENLSNSGLLFQTCFFYITVQTSYIYFLTDV